MGKKIKRDYERIIDEIAMIDERILNSIIKMLYTDSEMIEFKAGNITPISITIAMLIMSRPKKVDYTAFLKKIIAQNEKIMGHYISISMNFAEIEAVFEKRNDMLLFTDTGYFLVFLKFLSANIFGGDTLERIRQKCQEVSNECVRMQEENSKGKEKEIIQIAEEFKGSMSETDFNGMIHEYPDYQSIFNKYDPDDIAEQYLCDYDSRNKVYNNVKRGFLYFIKHKFHLIKEQEYASIKLFETLDDYGKRLLAEKKRMDSFRMQYNADKDRIHKFKIYTKILKKEIQRLNAKVLKKIDKSSNKELENKVHSLQKDSNYFQSRIEKLEEQIAVLEEEKLLNKELAENIIIEEEKEKKAIELPEYQNIVIMGGRWTSNNRKDVVNYLPDNDIEFIDADKTLRHFDRIANADIIFFDTSYNSHSYYYRAKKCHNDFYHINGSNLHEVKKVFEDSQE